MRKKEKKEKMESDTGRKERKKGGMEKEEKNTQALANSRKNGSRNNV